MAGLLDVFHRKMARNSLISYMETARVRAWGFCYAIGARLLMVYIFSIKFPITP